MTTRPKRIVILTGSGISAESGISTFRDKDGIWSRYRLEDVATPEAFARAPDRVLAFYNMRRRVHHGVRPNAAHEAVARLEKDYPGEVLLVTQNVDQLHELAGSRNLVHMHGEVFRAWCLACDWRCRWRDELSLASTCPGCGASGRMRPDVVWFGETPYHLDRIGAALEAAELFVSIGTSGTVYPAAGFVGLARRSGARTVEINLEPSHGASQFDAAFHGPATREVPAFVDRLLGEGAW
jgi:NAD-dependent deacetylase